MNNHPTRRLIEISLPLKPISAQSAREKSIRHGHISALHIWWARRPLAAMRAAIFASLIPAPDSDEKRQKLEDLIATIVDWDQVKDGNSAKIREAQDFIWQAFPDRPPHLLDPFMGGGSTGLEALHLGCETHAVELNPVAHLIELCTLVYPQKYGQISEPANQRTTQHATRDTPSGTGRLPGLEHLAEAPSNPLAVDVRKWGQWVLERAREEIGHLYKNPVSDETIVAEGQAGRMWESPLAVICEQDGTGKDYRPFTEQDNDLFQEALALLVEVDDDAPDEPLPQIGTLGFRVQRYGLTCWSDLFSARQLLALITFSRQVCAAYGAMLARGMAPERAKAVATYLGVALDRLADFSSSLTRWVSQGEFIASTFGRHALPMIWDYAEVNPFSGSTGDWSGALEWIVRVIEHTAHASDQSAIARQGTAARLPYSDGRFEAVVTDPPYYDAVPYADLSDFFYVWLKRSVGFLYPDLFRTPLTPKSAEIIQEPARHGDDAAAKAFYEQEMTRTFTEARRVLRADGIFVVVFAHKSTAAWETLLNSLLEAGLVVTASWPLHTERPGRLRAQESAALASSIFIICRVRAAETEGYFDDVREELATTIRERLDFFWKQGIRGADFFLSAIGPAVSVFGRYTKVYRLDGSEVGVDALLDLVQAMVSEYALDRILNGGAGRVGVVDVPTRYYILHRWAYGRTKIPFDDAMRLAMALGADVSALMERRGLLKQSGETVRLLGPRERGGLQGLGLPSRDGMAAPVIDVLHRAASLWESGDREALARFLAEGARAREDQVRLAAQTLINILPDDDPERRLLEGFLAGRDVLPEVPRQERLFSMGRPNS
jgi:putative DNA methylase